MTIPQFPDTDPVPLALADVLADIAPDSAETVELPDAAMTADPRSANETVEPNPPETIPDASAVEATRRGIRVLLGPDCPLAMDADPVEADWVAWVRGRWEAHAGAVERHLHLTARNRLYRMGQQWIASVGGGPWRDIPKPKESTRAVYNLLGPALDFRLQVIAEQRPGFTMQPVTSDPHDKRAAQARQAATDYQYDQCGMRDAMREAGFWSQTDGVAFWHVWWDPDRGPWDALAGTPMGDLCTEVLRVEQVRASANATATVSPDYVVIKRVIPAAQATDLYGYAGAVASASASVNDGYGIERWVMQNTTVGEGDRLRDTDTVDVLTIYCRPVPGLLDKGLQLTIVGDTVVQGPLDLLFGVLPVIPVRDGSSDPSYYPRPIMEQWVDHQTRLNAVLSKLVDNVRANAGGRFLARPNTLSQETFVGGMTSIVEVKGAGALGDAVMPLQGFSIGADAKDLLALEKQAIEDKSGWNATSRGQVSGESGRAIIAARESLERVFAPSVYAMADAFTAWAKVVIRAMRWGYDLPRALGVAGAGRPDLAKQISGDDLGDTDASLDVVVEPGTMMPQPLSFRLFQLDTLFDKGLIDAREYRRRSQFAVVRDLHSPDEDQEARAKRVADAIRDTANPMALPMLWQDDEAIHQDVLQRDLILPDDTAPAVRQAAIQRWDMLAQQAAQKQGGQPAPATPLPDANGGGAVNSPFAPSAATQPLAASNPPLPIAPEALVSDAEQGAQAFDAIQAPLP